MPMPQPTRMLGIQLPTSRRTSSSVKMPGIFHPSTASSSEGSIYESEPSLEPPSPDKESSDADDSAYDEPLFLDHYLTSEDEYAKKHHPRAPPPPALKFGHSHPRTSDEPHVWGLDNADDGWYGPSGSMDFYDDMDFSIHDVITTTVAVVPPGRAKVVYVSPPPSPYGSSEHSRSSSLDCSDASSPTSESPPESISEASDPLRTPEAGEDCFPELIEPKHSPPPIPARSSSHKLNRRSFTPPRIYTDIKPFAQRAVKSALPHQQSFGPTSPQPDYFGEEQWADANVPQMAKRGSVSSSFTLQEPPSPDLSKKLTHKRARILRHKLSLGPSFLRA